MERPETTTTEPRAGAVEPQAPGGMHGPTVDAARHAATDGLDYRVISELATDAIFVHDVETGAIVDANRQACDLHEYSLEELREGGVEIISDGNPPYDAEHGKAYMRKAASGKTQRFEWLCRTKSGARFWVDVRLHLVVMAGEPRVLAIVTNINERKRTEKALRDSEESYRCLFDSLPELVYIQDLEGRFLTVNDAVIDTYGYTREELLGETPGMLAAPGKVDVEDTMRRFGLAVEGKRQRFEWWGQRKDGSIFPKEVVLSRSTYFGQDVVIAVARDISARVRAERSLVLQNALLEAAWESSIDGILVVGPDGSIQSHNQRFVDLWKIPDDVVESRSDEAAIQAVIDQVADPKKFTDRIAYLYEHPDVRSRDTIVLKDGRTLDRYTSPVTSESGEYHGRIWFFRDVTPEKEYERMLERARLDAETAQAEAERAREEANHHLESLEREMDFGRRVQEGLLPAALPKPEGWDVGAHFCPALQVAGDFYDAFELPGGHLGLMVADVSGKGVGAAIFMALFQSHLRVASERANIRSASRSADSKPCDEEVLARAVVETNDYITRLQRNARMFASVFFGVLDPASGVLQYVNAGHEPPVLLRSDGGRERIAPTGPALGLMPDAEFKVGSIQLGSGDTLVAYTDGVTEARDVDGGFFGEKRLLELLDVEQPTARDLVHSIDRAVKAFAINAPQHDDVTVLAVRRR